MIENLYSLAISWTVERIPSGKNSRYRRSARLSLSPVERLMNIAASSGVPKWPANSAAANLPLAARPRVGHIRLNGAVAEWLKAAVC